MNSMFLEILNIQSVSGDTERMSEYIMDKAFELGCDVEYTDGNLYVTKGISPDDTYPCIVSHTDTVHDIIPDQDYMVVYDDNIAMAYDLRKMKPTGIGGDDKVGIYIALRMLEDLPYCKAAFFRDEEIGCVGSNVADMSFFNDVRFVLQCDRRGNSDFVYNILGVDLYNDKFYNDIAPIITKHGYSETMGGLTDVYQLAINGVGVAVANMSCGYFNPHSDDEMINLIDVDNCMSMVYEIMASCTSVYKVKHKDKWSSKYSKYGSSSKTVHYDDYKYDEKYWYGWEYNNGKWSKKIEDIKDENCWACGCLFHEHDLSDEGLCIDCEAYQEELIKEYGTDVYFEDLDDKQTYSLSL